MTLREKYERILVILKDGERMEEFSAEEARRISDEEAALVREAGKELPSVGPEGAVQLIPLVEEILKTHGAFRKRLLRQYDQLKVKMENLGVAKVNLKHMKEHYAHDPRPVFMDRET